MVNNSPSSKDNFSPHNCWYTWDIVQLPSEAQWRNGAQAMKTARCAIKLKNRACSWCFQSAWLTTRVTRTSALPMHFEKSSLHSDRIRGRKLHCNKSRERNNCLGFNLRRTFKIRALRSGDKTALVRERSELGPRLESSTAELAVVCLTPEDSSARTFKHDLSLHTCSPLRAEDGGALRRAGHRAQDRSISSQGSGSLHKLIFHIRKLKPQREQGQQSPHQDTLERGGVSPHSSSFQ